jgi:hypothetical protein
MGDGGWEMGETTMDRGPEKTSGEINISRIPVNGIGGLVTGS